MKEPRVVHLLIMPERYGEDKAIVVCGKHITAKNRAWAVDPVEALKMVETQEQMFARLNSLKFSRCPDCWNKDNIETTVAINALSQV